VEILLPILHLSLGGHLKYFCHWPFMVGTAPYVLTALTNRAHHAGGSSNAGEGYPHQREPGIEPSFWRYLHHTAFLIASCSWHPSSAAQDQQVVNRNLVSPQSRFQATRWQ
jgi:hypothetical protein